MAKAIETLPPVMPCKARATNMAGRLSASPNTIKVRELAPREAMKIGLRPYLSDSRPHMGATTMTIIGMSVNSSEISNVVAPYFCPMKGSMGIMMLAGMTATKTVRKRTGTGNHISRWNPFLELVLGVCQRVCPKRGSSA